MMYSIPIRIEMKISHLVLGVLLLALVCSQAMAISKSDLISYYRTNSSFIIDKPKIPDSPAAPIITPTPQPTPLPIPASTYSFFSTGTLMVVTTPPRASVYLDETFKGISPVKIIGVSGGVHQLKVTKEGYGDYFTDIIVTNGKTSSISVRLYDDPWGPLPPPSIKATDCIKICYVTDDNQLICNKTVCA
jgi:hypothetical protein